MLEDLIATAATEWSCAKAIQKYAKGADSNDAEMFTGAFTPDGVWVRPDGQEIKGHDALRTFLLARPTGGFARHIISNIVVDVLDASTAVAASLATVLKYPAPANLPLTTKPATMLACYDDQLRLCADGQWRIARRRVTLLMDLPASSGGTSA
ncbi:MAG: nuclear transport factor 2 family protein [Proteobacteria bacterium]|jgi:uncharacterized protein (TIGR02246 family)|nr:nuclear transport factor 2 family protein [Pseudomonadota bacterium]